MAAVVGRMLERRALLDGSREAVVCNARRLTYRDFDKLTGQVAALLRKHGITAGDRIAALLYNGIEYACLYHATARLGAVLCPLNWRLAVPEIASIIDNCGARLLFYDVGFGEAVSRLPPVQNGRIAIDSSTEDGFEIAGLSPFRDVCPVGSDAPLLIIHTSGTSGRPKGVVLTQGQMAWSSLTMATTLDYRSGDRGLISAPMFHVGGLSFATLFVHMGATAVFTPVWKADRALALIEREGINHFFAVPAMLDGLVRSESFDTADLGSLRWIMSGGAPLPASLVGACAARGVPVIQSYGTTETAGPATVVPVAGVAAGAGSSGLPFFHTDIRIADPAGNAVAAGASGEVLVKGPHVSSGYWEDAESTAAAFRNGWLRTGDSGFLDPAGRLHIDGRLREMIITGGENVFPAEVETVLESHPHVAEAAVIGVPDPRWGEAVCAVVRPGGGSPPTLADLIAHCSDRLARYKHPRRLVLRSDPFPRNPMGKLLRNVLGDAVRPSVGDGDDGRS